MTNAPPTISEHSKHREKLLQRNNRSRSCWQAALAAVTSFLLSSKIGIAGSVIGVAVASIVSSSASQLYQNVIDASSKKLQDAAQQVGVAPPHANAHTGDHSTAISTTHRPSHLYIPIAPVAHAPWSPEPMPPMLRSTRRLVRSRR